MSGSTNTFTSLFEDPAGGRQTNSLLPLAPPAPLAPPPSLADAADATATAAADYRSRQKSLYEAQHKLETAQGYFDPTTGDRTRSGYLKLGDEIGSAVVNGFLAGSVGPEFRLAKPGLKAGLSLETTQLGKAVAQKPAPVPEAPAVVAPAAPAAGPTIMAPSGSGTTQIAGTTPMYRKAAEWLQARKPDATTVLDYGAGLGLGADEMRSVFGSRATVHTMEPNVARWKGAEPPTYTDHSQIKGQYDLITNTNVINVLPREIRDSVVRDIGAKLAPGGHALVTARGWSGDVAATKNATPGGEPNSIFVQRGNEKVFQKGFDGTELLDYTRTLLGPGYTVEKAPFGKAGVVITRDAAPAAPAPAAPAVPASGGWAHGSGKVPPADIPSVKTGEVVWTNGPFPVHGGKNYDNLKDRAPGGAAGDLMRVPLNDLMTIQPKVRPAKVESLTALDVSHEGYPPLHVGKFDGQLVIKDGNHRAAAAYAKGETSIPAHVVDYDAPANAKFKIDAAPAVAPAVSAAPAPPGFRSYHGSGADFPRFSNDHIGSGEGTQAYGHGHYVADAERTAETYRNDATKRQPLASTPEAAAKLQDMRRGVVTYRDAERRAEMYESALKAGADPKKIQPLLEDERAAIAEALPLYQEAKSAGLMGHMYEVNVRAEPAHFLDWDGPLAGQHANVQAVAAKYGIKDGPGAKLYDRLVQHIADHPKDFPDMSVGPSEMASRLLKDAGIPGIRFLDQGSRQVGDGTRNSVIFDPATIEILRKYGIAGLLAGGGAAVAGGEKSQ